MKFGDYIWNHHEKCIQMSPNMPGIDSIIYEIKEFLEKKTIFWIVKPWLPF